MTTSIQVTFDCADPDRLARFWADVLGYQVQPPPPGFASWPEFLAARGIPEHEQPVASAIVDPAGAGHAATSGVSRRGSAPRRCGW